MIYKWKAGSHIKASATAAGEVFEELERTVGLTPANLVEASKPKSAPLHGAFEWNNTKAAEKYREYQAGHLIRCIAIVHEQEEAEPVTIRAYHPTADGVYENISVIVNDEEKMEALLQRALRELGWFKAKYESLSQLTPVMDAIDEVLEAENG